MPILPPLDHTITIGDCFWVHDGSDWVKFGDCDNSPGSSCTCVGTKPSTGVIGQVEDCPCDCSGGSGPAPSGRKIKVTAEVHGAPHPLLKGALYMFVADGAGGAENKKTKKYAPPGATPPPGYTGPNANVTVNLGTNALGTSVRFKMEKTEYKDLESKFISFSNKLFSTTVRAGKVLYVLFK